MMIEPPGPKSRNEGKSSFAHPQAPGGRAISMIRGRRSRNRLDHGKETYCTPRCRNPGPFFDEYPSHRSPKSVGAVSAATIKACVKIVQSLGQMHGSKYSPTHSDMKVALGLYP